MHTPVWHTPQPLWKQALGDPAPHARFRRPALLRFASDAFMDEVQAQLAADPASLDALVARAETWRDEGAGWSPVEESEDVIKLYQPVHQRYYLVTASLVCQVRGLPDRTVDVASQEATSFVLRRLPLDADGVPLDETTPGYTEYGWFGDGGWKPLDGSAGLDRVGGTAGGDGAPTLEREERLPLFPLAFTDSAFGNTRRLLAGFIPVAGRETFETAPRADAPPPTPDPGDPLGDPRLGDYEARVVYGLLPILDALDPAPGEPVAHVTDEDVREPFAFALLDLLLFLETYLPSILAAVQVGSGSGLTGEALLVFSAVNRLASHGVALTTLSAIHAERDFIESGEMNLSGHPGTLPGRGLDPLARLTSTQIEHALLALRIRDLDYSDAQSLNRRVRDALGPYEGGYETAEPVANPAVAGRIGSDGGAVYAIRCVYERPRCRRYGLFPLVSARSRPFRLAGFFDPDAPVRPTRIALPVDTSVAGLRSFPKAVSFLISDQLRAQLDRVQGIKLEALDKGEIGEEGGWTLGMICSLSIPIITICAFILLLIIVFVLNIVFWWIPFFRICFPIPIKK